MNIPFSIGRSNVIGKKIFVIIDSHSVIVSQYEKIFRHSPEKIASVRRGPHRYDVVL